VGIESGRLRIDWVSASEGNRFAQVVADLTDRVRELGPLSGLRDLPASARASGEGESV
jgi:coenzyme F420-reducing hydrogenase delta subunit